MTLQSGEAVYALLTDGTEIELRPPGSDDVEAVRAMHESMSQENLYLRFFGFSSGISGRVAATVCRPAGPRNAALTAWLGERLVGVAGYEPTDEPGTVELAVAVADDMHHRGVGTLLLEHLGSYARMHGIAKMRADTLADNHPMQRVAASAGMRIERTYRGGVVEMRLGLEPDEEYLDAVAGRESTADVASLAHVLRPSSIVVIGAGRRPGSVGHAVLRGLLASPFTGEVYAVNPHAGARLLEVVCVPTVAALPVVPELAIVAVPAAQVPGVARECGRFGVRALVVITSGLNESEGRALREACHRYGMRMVGPNCLGIANTAIGLDATFAAQPAKAGQAGLVAQSGGVGISLMEQLSRLGVGISTFVSAGDKYDVSATDLLNWWETDGQTKLGILHLESYGNPRKFSRTARRVARSMPLLTVVAGRSAAGRRAAASHTAAAATPAVTQEALFSQAGVIATRGLGELVDTAALLAHQGIPGGPRIGIVSNAGGLGVLAADACTDQRLSVAAMREPTRSALAALLPATAATAGPVDTTAAISAETYRQVLDLVLADDCVDAVIAVVAPTAISTLTGSFAGLVSGKPVAVVVLDQADSVRIQDGLPCYAFPEQAAAALARAWLYGEWKARPYGTVPALSGIRQGDASRIIGGFLKENPGGGWLPPAAAMELVESYGVPMVAWRWAATVQDAIRAFEDLGGRVVAKADVPGIVHKSAAGAVQLDLRSPAEVGRAWSWFEERFGDRLRGVLVQAMEPDGTEMLCGVVQEPVFGPLVVCGQGGVHTDALADRTARLTPLTTMDAACMLGSLRLAPLLPADCSALEAVLIRLGRLADDHAEIAEIDLNPVVVHASGVTAVDARVRVEPRQAWDPYLRRLR